MPWRNPDARELSTGWELAGCEPDECPAPDRLDRLQWIPAQVPGTAAAALRAAGRWHPGDALDFDAQDWWFRVTFGAEAAPDGERVMLVLGGIATVAEVYLNGNRVLESESMFVAHALDVSATLEEANELAIRCLALGPLLRVARRPRARWRTRLVSERNLRFFRTMLLGRAPGFAPGPAPVGPWKPVRLARQRGVVASQLRVRTRVSGEVGRVSVRGRLERLPDGRPLSSVVVELSGPTGRHTAALAVQSRSDDVAVDGELVVENAERWWPHTHGAPTLYEANVVATLGEDEIAVAAGRVGFRSLEASGNFEHDGIQLRINDVDTFARGAVWTPLDLARPCSPEPDARAALRTVAAAGMNMLRVPGIGCYEGEAFYDLCDELGILVWQDFMFANLDYPDQDAEFIDRVSVEVRQALDDLGGRPSLAVLCGSSEVAQQAAMMGLDPNVIGNALYDGLLPAAISAAQVDAPYVPSTPWGGDLPFRPAAGVANYYGVGAYLRPLDDARRAEVKFAAECLAFSNVPDDDALEQMQLPGGVVTHHPGWKAGVPRDVGAGWDFEDVRDHYLLLLFGIDPVALRSTDPERYLELSRHTSGEVMAEVLGEWRRQASACGGALVLWLSDLVAGAGWGLLDHRGRPKVAYHHVRRACAPVAVWSTDEGLGGVLVHVANDRPDPLEATLRIATYQDFEHRVDEIEQAVAVGPHGARAVNVESLLGRFVDVSWAYRFGPPAQNLIVASLEQPAVGKPPLIAQTFRFPVDRPTRTESPPELGLEVAFETVGETAARITIAARRLAYGVRVQVPGFVADDDAFSVEPGHTREVQLRRDGEGVTEPSGYLTALNLTGRVPIRPATPKPR